MFKNTINNLKLDVLGECDIDSLITLSESVGWDYDRDEIATVMKSGKIVGHRNKYGQLVSSAAIICYDTKLASIGMVIVHKDYRGQGLGKQTTQACLNLVPEQTAILLIATPDGKPLYEKMGFIEVGSVSKFICTNYHVSDEPIDERYQIGELENSDFEDVVKLDSEAFGDSRKGFLLNRMKQSKKSLVIKDEVGKIVGYAFSVIGPVNMILGPIVAPNYKAATYLINQLALNHIGSLRIDIPLMDEKFVEWLENRGFEKVSQPPIMIKNSNSMPTRNNHLFGIAAQVFG